MNNMKYRTAESVTEGHPDKLCDLIADSILDACLRRDPDSRVACEVMAAHDRIIVAGEITCRKPVPIKQIVGATLHSVGYDPSAFDVDVYITAQSPDIAYGISAENGAGDQGTMYGYACSETDELLPLPVVLANRLAKRLMLARKGYEIEGLLPDGKTQVTVRYENDEPRCISAIVISAQHDEDKPLRQLRDELFERVVLPTFNEQLITKETKFYINPSGRFVLGGPAADTGLTGRKLMVDTYGGLASHGGGALCGKDATKVDRSGAYMARYIAKQFVAAGICERCEVAISYAIGKALPVAFDVCSFGTFSTDDTVLAQAARKVFDLRPEMIIETLQLQEPIFEDTAVYGHFGKPWLPWERIDRIDALREAVNDLVSEQQNY